VCSADVDASSFDVRLSAQKVRIAIHRRKGTTLKSLFIVVPFFSGCFIVLKDREVVLAAIVAGRTGFAGFRYICSYPAFPILRHFSDIARCPA
jgi:hypothetical protein